MKYIVTGGAGFIGSHLAEALIKESKRVVVIDNLSTGSLENLKNVWSDKNFRFVHGDVRTFSRWNEIIAKNDVIIHLAATVGVNKVMVNGLETVENNYVPTQILLELALQHQCKFFFSSTSEVYGSADTPSAEQDPLVVPGTHCGRSAYVLGKIMSEHYCMQYFTRHALPVIVGRFFNAVGPRQMETYGMVAPTFIKQALRSKLITVYGNGDQTRSFCDVEDIVHAVLQLLETDQAFGEIFNIGSEESTTIAELAEYIRAAANSRSPIVFLPFPEQRDAGRDIRFRKPNLQKIQALTGWRPLVDFRTSLKNIIQYQMLHTQPEIL